MFGENREIWSTNRNHDPDEHLVEYFFSTIFCKKITTISAPLDLRAFQGDQGPQSLPTNMQQGMLLQRPVFKMNPTNEFWDQSRIPSETPPNSMNNANNATINRTQSMANTQHANGNSNSLNANSATNNVTNQSTNLMVNSQSMLPPGNTETNVNTSSRTPDTNCNQQQNLPISNFNSQDANTNSTPNTNSVDNQSIESANMNQNNALALPDHKIMTEKLVSELQVRGFFVFLVV